MTPFVLKTLASITGQKTIFPFYHAVANNTPVHLQKLYKVRSAKQFENDLNLLLKTYTPVSLSDVAASINNDKKLPKLAFHISFDDGLRQFAEVAFPILDAKGIPCSLFVNPQFIDNKELFFRFKVAILVNHLSKIELSDYASIIKNNLNLQFKTKVNFEQYIFSISYAQKDILDKIAEHLNVDFSEYLNKEKPYLRKTELLSLQSKGVEIGAHSMSHPLFNQLTAQEQTEQFVKSVDWINLHFNQKVKAFSFPFTDYGVSKSFFNSMYSKNNKTRVDISFGTAGLKRESFEHHFHRIPVESSSADLNNQLLKHYLYYIAKAPLFKNTIRRQ